jgi:hypothetical protein
MHDVGIGYTRFIWATTKAAPDKTSGSMWLIRFFESAWQAGLFGLVRLTLPAEGFRTWREIIRREGWDKYQVARLARDDRQRIGEDGHDQWRCGDQPLPLANVLKAEVAFATSRRWRPLALDPGRVVKTENSNRLGYRLGRKVLFSERVDPTNFSICLPQACARREIPRPCLPSRTKTGWRMPPLRPDGRLKRLMTTTTGGSNE